MTGEEREGWAFPINSRKWHYFVDARSLCNRWVFIGDLQADEGYETADDCKPCRKALNKLKEVNP